MNRLADPRVSALVVLGALGVPGLMALVLAWRGAAATVNVATQVAFVVSGGIGGLGLMGFAFGVAVIQNRRFVEARRRAEWDGAIQAATALLATVREARGMR